MSFLMTCYFALAGLAFFSIAHVITFGGLHDWSGAVGFGFGLVELVGSLALGCVSLFFGGRAFVGWEG